MAEIEKRYTVDKRVYHIIERDTNGEQTGEFFFPSVTTILDKTEPKNYLLNQFQMEEVEQKGQEGARFALWMSAERGTKIHKAIEDYNAGKDLKWFERKQVISMKREAALIDGQMTYVLVEGEPQGEVEVKNFDDFEWRSICHYMDWRNKYNPEFITLEEEVYSKKHGYAGTMDCFAKINNLILIGDWKSSKDIYDKYKMQIAAYYMAKWEMTGKQPDGGFILSLNNSRSKEGWKMEMMDVNDIEKWFNRFLNRIALFKDMEPDFHAKRDLLPVAFTHPINGMPKM